MSSPWGESPLCGKKTLFPTGGNPPSLGGIPPEGLLAALLLNPLFVYMALTYDGDRLSLPDGSPPGSRQRSQKIRMQEALLVHLQGAGNALVLVEHVFPHASNCAETWLTVYRAPNIMQCNVFVRLFACLFVCLQGGQAVLVAHSPEVCLGAAGPHGIPVRLRSVTGAHLNQCISRSSRNLAR